MRYCERCGMEIDDSYEYSGLSAEAPTVCRDCSVQQATFQQIQMINSLFQRFYPPLPGRGF